MITLYPDIEPYITHHIQVGSDHVLMVEECGNPEGIPVIFLHGGPGSHCKPYHRSFFNPSLYRIILLDQRGVGRSTPIGSLQNNTTWDLLSDIETIRKQLGIENWVIFGGSWGATLGLLYTQQHPDHVLGLVLRSTFLARERDIHWIYGAGGVNRFFPKQWETFTRFLPEGRWDTPLAIYYNLLTSDKTDIVHQVTLAWAAWSSCVVSRGQFSAPTEMTDELLNEARLECHYLFNHCFIEEDQILQSVETIADIPAIIVHGQCDLMCPLENSRLLEQEWAAAQLRIVPTGGHLARDPDMIAAIVEATDEMAKIVAAFLKGY